MGIAILGLYVMCMIVVSAHMTSYVQPYTRDKTLECTTGYENVERSSTPLSARRHRGEALVLSGGMAVEARSAYVVLLTLYC